MNDEIDGRVTPEMMQQELHIDGEEELLKDLIEDGEEYIVNSIDHKISLADYYKHKRFKRAVKTFVTGYYYDRTSGITSNKALTAFINQISASIRRNDYGND